MLKDVFNDLDTWAVDRNLKEDAPLISNSEILIIGQSALIAAKLNIPIIATMDVDCFKEIEHVVRDKFEELLKAQGKKLDPVGHEAWMPTETKFTTLFNGKIITGKIAEPVFIIISKAKKAPEKNKNLIAEYIASDEIDKRFFKLAQKYKIKLQDFV